LNLQHSGNSKNAGAAPENGTWIVTDGSVGMEAQGIAVAEAVGFPYSLKRVRVTGAMRLVPARLQIYVPPRRLLDFVSSNGPLAPPWPRLIISIGRRSVPIALRSKAWRRLSHCTSRTPKSQSSAST
jgi:mitochondrial fission protein ELM1